MTADGIVTLALAAFAYAVIALPAVGIAYAATEGDSKQRRARWTLVAIFWPSAVVVFVLVGVEWMLRAFVQLTKDALPERDLARHAREQKEASNRVNRYLLLERQEQQQQFNDHVAAVQRWQERQSAKPWTEGTEHPHREDDLR